MNAEEAKGLVIFAGIWAALAFTLAGCMERKLRKLNRIICKIEEDAEKYVN